MAMYKKRRHLCDVAYADWHLGKENNASLENPGGETLERLQDAPVMVRGTKRTHGTFFLYHIENLVNQKTAYIAILCISRQLELLNTN